jgi:ATP-dependent DNA helicase RecQ
MNKGRIHWYNPKKGFGFIFDKASNSDIYFHCSNVLFEPINGNEEVTFSIRPSTRKQGTVEAIEINIIET